MTYVPGGGGGTLATTFIGGVFFVVWDSTGSVWKDAAGTTITTRPTSRTDVKMLSFTTAVPPVDPSFAIAGDVTFSV